MLKLWNKIQKHRDSLSDSSREKGLIAGLIFGVLAISLAETKLGELFGLCCFVFNAHHLSKFYLTRNK